MRKLFIIVIVVVIVITVAVVKKKSVIAPGPSESPTGLTIMSPSPMASVTSGVAPTTPTKTSASSSCQPYVCADGTQFPRCTESETPINYFVEPCLSHGGQVFQQRASPTPTPENQTVTVTFTNGGASPNMVNIRIGNTVKFVNNDDTPRWPASGVHPTHQICPGFDALHGLAKGESYSFAFKVAKTCPFHDHLNPSLHGQIVVTQ